MMYTVLPTQTKEKLNKTLNKFAIRIRANQEASENGSPLNVTIYFDTCFLMRDYVRDVYMVIKDFVENANLPEGSMEFVILDEVEKELEDKALNGKLEDRRLANNALSIMDEDRSEARIFTHKNVYGGCFHDSALKRDVIDVRQMREILVFSNDWKLQNELLFENYSSAVMGNSITTVSISRDGRSYSYRYADMTPNFYYELSEAIHRAYLDRNIDMRSRQYELESEA